MEFPKSSFFASSWRRLQHRAFTLLSKLFMSGGAHAIFLSRLQKNECRKHHSIARTTIFLL
jgi:hypothetical protein